jgi:nitrite reductase/ring-hydroxylating ferredoxin subunit
MAEDCKSCPLLVERRSLLRGGAALAVAAAFSDGCATSEPIETPNGAAGAGGSQAGRGGSGASGGAGAGGAAGASGAGGSQDAGATGGPAGAAGGAGGTGNGGSGGAGAGGGGSAGSNAPRPDAGGGDADASVVQCYGATAAGKATSLAVGGLVAAAPGLLVGRDAGGLYAMSSLCTHQGCGLNIVGTATKPSLHCPCHGSAFSATGAVTNGPARAPLIHYNLHVSASGDVTVCMNEIVAATTRSPG